MFKHILIPTDLSDRADRAARVVGDLSRLAETSITVLHVIETIPGATFEEFRTFYADLERRASERLSALASALGGTGALVSQAVAYGKRGEEIVRYAVEHDVDLIVLTSHPIDPSRPGRGWGTLSYRVGVLAPCAVLLVK